MQVVIIILLIMCLAILAVLGAMVDALQHRLAHMDRAASSEHTEVMVGLRHIKERLDKHSGGGGGY